MKFKNHFRLIVENFDELPSAVQAEFAKVKALDKSLADKFIKMHSLKMKGKDLDVSKVKTITLANMLDELTDFMEYLTDKSGKRKTLLQTAKP